MRVVRYWLTLICIGIALYTASPLLAQNPTDIDGTIWRRMKYDNKYYWLLGYLQGLEKSDEIIQLCLAEQEKREFAFTVPFYVDQMRTRISAYFPPHNIQDITQLIELLNTFYKDKYNQKIKIEAALRIVLARQKGQIEQSDFWLNEARRALIQK